MSIHLAKPKMENERYNKLEPYHHLSLSEVYTYLLIVVMGSTWKITPTGKWKVSLSM